MGKRDWPAPHQRWEVLREALRRRPPAGTVVVGATAGTTMVVVAGATAAAVGTSAIGTSAVGTSVAAVPGTVVTVDSGVGGGGDTSTAEPLTPPLTVVTGVGGGLGDGTVTTCIHAGCKSYG